MMRQLQANINSDITCCKMCSTPGDTDTTTGPVLRGFADKHPETQKSCRGIWSWGFVEGLLIWHSPHWWNMTASVLNHKSLTQEWRSRESGSIFSFWTLGWWQNGVSVEFGTNTLSGWSRWSGLWKPCQSRCSWPETQHFPLPLSSNGWKGAEHSLQLWQCVLSTGNGCSSASSPASDNVWVFTILLQK